MQQVCTYLAEPVHYASADEPTLRGAEWFAQQWDIARLRAGTGEAILVLDEIQKIGGWSESVKRLWDEDTRHHLLLKVVLLGSAPLLIERGLTKSLAGRFEILRLPHWSAAEMRNAFGWSVVRNARRVTAIEVKSGRAADSLPGMQAIHAAFKPDRMLLVGGNGMTV